MLDALSLTGHDYNSLILLIEKKLFLFFNSRILCWISCYSKLYTNDTRRKKNHLKNVPGKNSLDYIQNNWVYDKKKYQTETCFRVCDTANHYCEFIENESFSILLVDLSRSLHSICLIRTLLTGVLRLSFELSCKTSIKSSNRFAFWLYIIVRHAHLLYTCNVTHLLAQYSAYVLMRSSTANRLCFALRFTHYQYSQINCNENLSNYTIFSDKLK